MIVLAITQCVLVAAQKILTGIMCVHHMILMIGFVGNAWMYFLYLPVTIVMSCSCSMKRIIADSMRRRENPFVTFVVMRNIHALVLVLSVTRTFITMKTMQSGMVSIIIWIASSRDQKFYSGNFNQKILSRNFILEILDSVD